MHIQRILTEGITHIEDLPIDEFVDTLRNMATMAAQEKLDGAQLWVGSDEEGKLFTSREGKRNGAERRYTPEDWPLISAFNQFRAAHAAIAAKSQEIQRVLRPGDTVEAEVLFGRQPNSVTYGAHGMSFVAFLRGVNDTPNEIADHLASSLVNQQAEAKVDVVDTADGKELSTTNISVTFQFVSPHKLDTKKLKADAGIEPMLDKLDAFLKKPSGFSNFSNLKLATTMVSSVPKELKSGFKPAKEALLTTLLNDYQLPIKAALLSKLHRKSGLAADDIKPDEDVGIEGIVLRDASGNQVKIVDRDVFTAINKFNQTPRGEVQSALNTTDPDAPLEARGGLLGQMRIRFAEALGNRELAKASNVRKAMEPVKGDSAEETIKNLAKSMSSLTDHEAVKKKILAIASETYKELGDKLEAFKTDHGNYKLQLKNGKEIGLSDETVKKTLLTFAEAHRNLKELFDKLKGTKSLAGLLAVLYGSAARAVHAEKLGEGLLLEKGKPKKKHAPATEISLADFNRRDTWHLVNAFLGTVFMSMLVVHSQDMIGLRFLRDRKNWRLLKHDDEMSPLNHWGYAVWRAAKPELEDHLTPKTRLEVLAITKKIPAPWWKYFHLDFSANGERKIQWSDHRRMLQRLIDLSGVRTERVNSLLDLSIRFPELDVAEQKSFIKKLSAFVRQFVPNSRLYPRLKPIAHDLKDEDVVTEGLLKRIAALTEEGEGGDAGADSGAGVPVSVPANGATNAGAISAVPTGLGNNRKTEMRRRNQSKEFLALTRKHKDPRNYKDVK
jgi:hypothetical protein